MKGRLRYQGFEKPKWWYVYLLGMAGLYLLVFILMFFGVIDV